MKMHFPAVCAVVVACLAVVRHPTKAATATFSPIKDNTLYESLNGTLSNGAGQDFYAGRTNQAGNSLRRGLIAFNLATVPTGSTVTAVTLSLHVSKSNSAGRPFSLHPLLANWGEGTSNAASGGAGSGGGDGVAPTTNDATWVHRFFNTPSTGWTTPGGDFRIAPSATQSVNGVGTSVFGPAAQMTADVQAWVNAPSTNFGWLLKAVDETARPSAKQFDSRENSTPANRPVLTVTFTPAPEPTSLTVLTCGTLLLCSRRPRRGRAV